MTDAFTGEIRAFAFDYFPEDWLPCDGRQLAVAEHAELFTVIGNAFGGDGKSKFKLPDLRGRVPLGVGAGPDLTPRKLNDTGGSEQMLLEAGHLPNHTHFLQAQFGAATQGASKTPAPTLVFGGMASTPNLTPYLSVTAGEGLVSMASEAVSSAGGNAPHENRQLYLALGYGICVHGEYPTAE